MSAFSERLWNFIPDDDWIDSEAAETAIELSAVHIEQQDQTIVELKNRIQDLEALFEPFLNHFLKQNETKTSEVLK